MPSPTPDTNPDGAAGASQELTRTPLYGERAIAEAELICFENPRPGRSYEISIDFPEFTCRCPFSGYPDFAELRLVYQPGPRVMELKALKLYIWSFRNEGHYFERATNRIADDLIKAMKPRKLVVIGRYNVRGGITSQCVVKYEKPSAAKRRRS